MATQSEFINTPVPVLNRSAFNKSHQNLLTMNVGTLTPVLVDELIPDTTVDLRAAALAKLPPLASDTFMRVKMHLEAFFVPFRILYGGYARAMSGMNTVSASVGSNGSTVTTTDARVMMPKLFVYGSSSASNSGFSKLMGPGTLSDYLGYKLPQTSSGIYPTGSSPLVLNIFPFLAYHRIYDDWYRNAIIQRPLFSPVTNDLDSSLGNAPRIVPGISQLPFTQITTTDASVGGDSPASPTAPGAYRLIFDGSGGVTGTGSGMNSAAFNNALGPSNAITSLRQRNFGHDYFTSATPSPTIGNLPVLSIASVGTADSGGNVSASGNFTIGALRSINSLTQFAERNALAGTRYSDWLKANYGTELSEQIEGRAQYLGRMVFDIYSKGVSQTGVSASSGDVTTQNPFKTVGAQYGDPVGAAEDTLMNNFYVREPGILMVIASVVPRVTYSSGAATYLRHYTKDGFRGDLANQILENVGPQPIMKSELDGNLLYGADAVFGYTDRFAEYKTKFDEVHGLLHDGQSLQAFALQRTFGASGAVLGSSFIEIPKNYLDQVSAVSGQVSQFGCWLDIAFDYKVVQPLSRYSIPSLVMPAEHSGNSHTEMVRRSGSHL